MKNLNKSQAELKRDIQEHEAKLKQLNAELEEMKAEEDFRKQLKANYKPNDVPSAIEYNYQAIYEAIKKMFQTHYHITKSEFETVVKANSWTRRPDPAKVYNCPECGGNDCLYIGEYDPDYSCRRYAITCSFCDFVGPKSSDFGEAWYNFEDWLRKKGYLKESRSLNLE